MKKILFLIFIGLAFVGCADPNNDDTAFFSERIYNGLTSYPGGYKWEIHQATTVASGTTTTQIFYSEVLANGKFVFSIAETGSNMYQVTTQVTDFEKEYTNASWVSLQITAGSNTFTLNNPSISASTGASSSTFGFTAWYAESIDKLKNADNFSVTYGTGGNAGFSVDLPTEFITAMKTYF